MCTPPPPRPPVAHRLSTSAFLALLWCAAALPALAGGANCTDVLCDEPAADIDLSISCSATAIDISPHVCGTTPSADYSLLQVAVRCFEPTEANQAQYSDLHRFAFDETDAYVAAPVSFDELLGNCGKEYIVAARWILGDTEVQAQCTPDPGLAAFPDCEPPSQRTLADLSDRFRLYSTISPVGLSDTTCFPAGPGGEAKPTDFSRMELRSAAIDHAYHAVLSGRYICAKTLPAGGQLTACDELPPIEGPAGCLGGQCGLVVGANLAPQSFYEIEINDGDNFDNCCDHQLDEDSAGDCGTADVDCSPYDIQCTTAAIFGACTDGSDACATPGAQFTPFTRVVWLGPTQDIEVGDHGTAKPSDLDHACLRFSFKFGTGVAPSQRRVQPHTFEHALPAPSADDECEVSGTAFRDDDFDGIYDECDLVVGNHQPVDGFGTVILRNKIRREGFTETFNETPSQNIVKFGTEAATVLAATTQELVVEIPSTASTVGELILWRDAASEEEIGAAAAQQMIPTWYGYATDGTAEGVLVLDSVSGSALDGNVSTTNAYVNLNCDPNDDVSEVSAPLDLAVRPVLHPTANPPVFADREVFALSDVTFGTPPQTESRLLPFKVEDHRLLQPVGYPAGIPLSGSARALDLAEDGPEATGSWDAYVAWEHFPGYGKISRVDVNDPTDPANWGSKQDGLISILGTPARIAAHYVSSSSTVKVYVTSVVCQGGGSGMAPMGPICIDCGGGPNPPSRELHVTILDGTDLSMNYGSYKISDTTPGCSERPTLQNLGLAFSEDRNLMFVANPDLDRVEVIRTFDQVKLAPIGLPAGCDPHDVDVVDGQAYVVCRGQQKVRIIDVGSLTLNTQDVISLVAEGQEPDLIPVAVATRSDGQRLFTADSTHRTISVVDIKPFSLFRYKKIGELHAGSNAARLVLLRLPTP